MDTDEKRSAGLQLLSAAAARVSYPAVLTKAAQKLRDVLMGVEGPLSAPYQRAAVAAAIGELRLSPAASAAGAVATQALIDALAKEQATDVFTAAVSAMGAWAAGLQPVPAAVVKEFSARAAKEKDEARRRAVLDSISRALATPAQMGDFAELAKELAAIVKATAAKPVTFGLALSALRLVLRIAEGGPLCQLSWKRRSCGRRCWCRHRLCSRQQRLRN